MPFLSTLSLRRATINGRADNIKRNISIHALLAESDSTFAVTETIEVEFLSTLSLRRATLGNVVAELPTWKFLSTLSLRRATNFFIVSVAIDLYFYPRSPCGERRIVLLLFAFARKISIHALLAESDVEGDNFFYYADISIHALLAESDCRHFAGVPTHRNFYPRSPCGERQPAQKKRIESNSISIHALLAESDYLATRQ